MKIVIDIPEEQFITLNAKTQKEIISVIDHKLLISAIQNGIPLPKGHGDLIDRDKVRTNIKETCDYTGCNIGFDDQYLLKCTINNIGTVIPADKGE